MTLQKLTIGANKFILLQILKHLDISAVRGQLHNFTASQVHLRKVFPNWTKQAVDFLKKKLNKIKHDLEINSYEDKHLA